jgi:hypothetical protein
MTDRAVGIPLAFVLALSAANSDVFRAVDSTAQLTPGSLKELLPQQAQPTSAGQQDKAADSALVDRTAQWFNWPNCFSGYWRRC